MNYHQEKELNVEIMFHQKMVVPRLAVLIRQQLLLVIFKKMVGVLISILLLLLLGIVDLQFKLTVSPQPEKKLGSRYQVHPFILKFYKVKLQMIQTEDLWGKLSKFTNPCKVFFNPGLTAHAWLRLLKKGGNDGDDYGQFPY